MTNDKQQREVTEEIFLNDLKFSLDDFLTDSQEENKAEKRYTKIKAAPVYSANDIKEIRKNIIIHKKH